MRTFLFCFSLLCLFSTIHAQMPDNSFGNRGKTVGRANNKDYVETRGGYVQPCGRVLISGDEFDDGGSGSSHVSAFTPGGAIDTTFGRRGATQLFGAGGGFIAKQSDNKIIALGVQIDDNAHYTVILQRLTADGQYDFSFGKGGKTITDHGYNVNENLPRCLTVDAADNIYIGGTFNSTSPVYDPARNKHFTIFRYKPNGAIDSSFYIIQRSRYEQECQSINVLTDGSLIASYVYDTLNSTSTCLIKYTPDGSLDKSFGDKGIVLFNNRPGPDDGDTRLHTRVLPDGSLLTVLSVASATTSIMMYKEQANGKADMSFGTNGVLDTKERTYNSDHWFDVEPSGKILLPLASARMKRLDADGSTDSSFGTNGIVQLAPVGQYYPGCDIALSYGNGFFAFGAVADLYNSQYAVAKFVYGSPAITSSLKQSPLAVLSVAKASVYPNPAHQSLQVSHISNLPAQLRITDVNGKTVLTLTAGSPTQSIDISRLANGTYFLQNGKENGAVRFIKE